MSDRDEIKKPLDHLPPAEERDDAVDLQEPSYPGTGYTDDSASADAVTPETAAEPDKAKRHGVDKLPPSGR